MQTFNVTFWEILELQQENSGRLKNLLNKVYFREQIFSDPSSVLVPKFKEYHNFLNVSFSLVREQLLKVIYGGTQEISTDIIKVSSI